MPGVLPAGPQSLTADSADDLLSKARADAYASLREASPGLSMQPQTGIHKTSISASAGAIPSGPVEMQQSDFVPSAPPPAPPPEEMIPAPAPEKPGYTVTNQVRKIANRGGQVLSDMTIGLADTLGDMAPDWMNSGIVWKDGGLKIVKGEEYDKDSFVANVADVLRDKDRQIVSNYDTFSAQDIKDAWAAGDKADVAKRTAVFALENGVASVPDMIAALTAAPGYFAGLASHYTQERVSNDGRDKPTATDVTVGTATAGMIFLLERFGADKVLHVLSTGNKGAFRKLFEGAVAEAVTEAAQSPVEDIGTKQGTKKESELTLANEGESALFGGIGGLGGGLSIGAGAQAVNAIMSPAAPAPSAAPPAGGGAVNTEATPSAPPTAASPANPAPTPPAAPAAAAPEMVPAAAPATPKPKTPAAPNPSSAQVDTPTPEPLKDLDAQVADMKDPATARKAVYLSPANLAAHGGLEGAKKIAGSGQVINNFDKKGGALIVMNQSEKVKAFNLRKKEPDMQKVLGKLLGSGEGKPTTPDAVVVQGQAPNGAVAKETVVVPAEVPGAVAEMEADGKTPVVTSVTDALARRAEEAPEPKRAIVKLANGKDAAVHVESETDTHQTVRLLDEQGEPTKQTVTIQKDRPAPVEATKPVEARTDKPVAIESEANTEVKVPKPAKPATALESLSDVLATHQQQETPPPGMKRPSSLRDRQDNASAFAQVLEAAAKESDAAPEVIARAARAAGAAKRLTLKSKEATEKGQGTSHARVTALVDEMHRAARQLMGKATEADAAPAVEPKAAALKNRLTKALGRSKEGQTTPTEHVAKQPPSVVDTVDVGIGPTAAKRPFTEVVKEAQQLIDSGKMRRAPAQFMHHLGVTAKYWDRLMEATHDAQEKVEVPVNPKYESQIERKPKVSDQLRAKKLMDDYVRADEKDVPAHTERIAAFLKETRPNATPEEITEVMNFIQAQREEVNPSNAKPKKLSETLEDDESVYDPDPNDGMSRVSRPSLVDQIKAKVFRGRAQKMWDDTFEALKDKGFYQKAAALAANGEAIGSHFLLDQIIDSTQDPVLKGMLQKLRQHVPDLPVHFTSRTKKFNKDGVYETSDSGLFMPKLNLIQIRNTNSDGTINSRSVRTIVHEMVHAATEYELMQNPKGELAQRIEGLRMTAVVRARKRLGPAFVDAHIAYFSGKGPKPEGYDRALYGLTNTSEFMTEAMTNPRFQQLLIESEGYVVGKGLEPTAQPSLLTRLFRTIGKWLGVESTALMDHVAETTQAIMEAQSKNLTSLYNKSSTEFAEQLPDIAREMFGSDRLMVEETQIGLTALFAEPKASYGENVLASIAGEEAAKTSRFFNHIVRSRAFQALRKNGIAFISGDQLFRGNRRFFGTDDATNPLVQLEEAGIEKNKQLNKMMDRAKPIAERRLQLPADVDKSLGQLQVDTTMWKIDPTLSKADQAPVAKDLPKFDARYDEFVARYNKLTDEAKKVYVEERDYNRWAVRELRKAGVDVALQSYGIDKISDAQRRLLYGAKTQYDYDGLIGGPRKDGTTRPIDLGEELNVPLRAALKEFAGITENEGPYFHLGRQGEFVVQVAPEGEKTFSSMAAANEFATRVRDLGPTSQAKVDAVGDDFVVKFKANYVSMHEDQAAAEADAERMRDAGFGVGKVTQKTLGKDSTPLSAGMKELAAEAERRINKHGQDEGSEALIQSLRSAFLQLQAARSAYAGARLARKNVGGVKGEDMRRNFAEHAQSSAWHTSQLLSAFKEASALAKVRSAARDSNADVDQNTIYRRGRIVAELGRRMTQEVRDYGLKTPANATIAKLGFMAYLASPAHALVNMTQNFTAGIPVAAARYGLGRSTAAFARGMKTVTGPAFRATLKAVFSKGGTATDVHNAIIAAVRRDPVMGKWAQGNNSQLQQLIDRGAISHSYSNELAGVARGESARAARVFEWARLTPNMADAFNRISTALALLELTKGDVRKTADFINETQIDYSQSNKPRAFKGLARVPGGAALTMFKTYTQGMAHLLYSNLIATMGGDRKAEAAKTVAGLMLANVLLAGVFKGAALEPLRLLMYAWQKLFGDDDEYYDPQNMVHTFLTEHLGKAAGNAAAYGLPNLAGFDMSSRMGLADLFFHNPPDLLTADKTVFANFLFENVGGPPGALLANNVSSFVGAMDRGEPFEAISSVIPVKAYQDAVKAAELFTTGKKNSLGASVTEPSGLDATYQLLGFRPASVARYQEKVSTSIARQKFLDDRKKSIVREYMNSDDPSSVLEKVRKFNETNPGAALTVSDFIKMQRAKVRTEMQADGAPGRDPELNEMLDY